jgi:hypothetical protein
MDSIFSHEIIPEWILIAPRGVLLPRQVLHDSEQTPFLRLDNHVLENCWHSSNLHLITALKTPVIPLPSEI